jgi:hypothetical protein
MLNLGIEVLIGSMEDTSRSSGDSGLIRDWVGLVAAEGA